MDGTRLQHYAQWIKHRGGTVTPRDLVRAGFRDVKTSLVAKGILIDLSELGYGEILPTSRLDGLMFRLFNVQNEG